MNTGTFRPSIDWSNELLTSTLWVMQMFVITASCLLVVLVLLVYLALPAIFGG